MSVAASNFQHKLQQEGREGCEVPQGVDEVHLDLARVRIIGSGVFKYGRQVVLPLAHDAGEKGGLADGLREDSHSAVDHIQEPAGGTGVEIVVEINTVSK